MKDFIKFLLMISSIILVAAIHFIPSDPILSTFLITLTLIINATVIGTIHNNEYIQ